ncbi:MAG: hypothetical protein EHM40_09620 [Chloroflexi bacterium]|nr:MAG: hypothetical protein EHM40_09620 [Chloroflexota bacterium]
MEVPFNRSRTVLLLLSSLMPACSLTIPNTFSSEPEYRYDDLPDEANESQGPELLPQTITIEQMNGSWFITTVDFFDAPAFCS